MLFCVIILITLHRISQVAPINNSFSYKLQCAIGYIWVVPINYINHCKGLYKDNNHAIHVIIIIIFIVPKGIFVFTDSVLRHKTHSTENRTGHHQDRNRYLYMGSPLRTEKPFSFNDGADCLNLNTSIL